MMKNLAMLLICILFIQVCVEASLTDDVVHSVPQEDVRRNSGELLKLNCGFACARRCSKASRPKICIRACASCCAACGCVPPGTYGNKNLCPCYANLKTHGNKSKCP